MIDKKKRRVVITGLGVVAPTGIGKTAFWHTISEGISGISTLAKAMGTATEHIQVAGIVRLCGDLGAEVVAEGIETIEELKAIRDTGVHYVQGFLLARPGFPLPKLNPLPL